MPDDLSHLQSRVELKRIQNSTVFTLKDDKSAFFYEAGMAIDADGAFRAYHPDNKSGLDNLHNAGKPGNFFALVTDTGKPSGNPVIQSAIDPAPGFFISTTSLEDKTKKRTDPRRYVDAESVPFIVLPGTSKFGAALSDLCLVFNPKNEKLCGGVFADIGPANKIGEASIAMAKALGVPSSPRNGGQAHGLIYIIFPASASGWPLSLDQIQERSNQRFTQWGGLAKLKAVMADFI
jgi:hypothetical protein